MQRKPLSIVLNGYNLRRFPSGLPEALRAAAFDLGFEAWVDISISLEHFHQLVRRAIGGGAETLLTGGGDGSLHHAINQPGIERVRLGVLPLGTINAWLRAAGVDVAKPEVALRQILAGRVIEGRLGFLNGQRFACFASWGFDARTVHSNPRSLKKVLGASSYGLTGTVELLRWRARENSGVLRPGGHEPLRATSVVVSKIQNYAGVDCFSARLTDPFFEALAVRHDDPASLLRMAAHIALRHPARGIAPPRGLRQVRRCAGVAWDSPLPASVQLDGEAAIVPAPHRLRLRADPVGQRYLVPKAYRG